MTRAMAISSFLREISTPLSAPIEQARDSAAQFNERRNRRSRQCNHLVVPSADALHEVEHLSESKLHDRIHGLVVPTHLDALAQSRRRRIQFANLSARRNAGDQRPQVGFR